MSRAASSSEVMAGVVARVTIQAVGRHTPTPIWRSDLAALLAERAELIRSLTKIAEWEAMQDTGDMRLVRTYAEATIKEAADHGYQASVANAGQGVAK